MLKRAAELLGFEGDVRDTHTLLEANARSPAAQQLTALKKEVFAGMAPTSILERLGAIAAAVEPRFVPGIEAIRAQAVAFEVHDPDFSTEHLLGLMALGMPSHATPTESGGIKLSTLHRTKGLEWPRVWILGLEEETLPFYLANGPDDVRDERRLLFVGICRAEHFLTLSSVRRLNGWSKSPSRFLAEVGV